MYCREILLGRRWKWDQLQPGQPVDGLWFYAIEFRIPAAALFSSDLTRCVNRLLRKRRWRCFPFASELDTHRITLHLHTDPPPLPQTVSYPYRYTAESISKTFFFSHIRQQIRTCMCDNFPYLSSLILLFSLAILRFVFYCDHLFACLPLNSNWNQYGLSSMPAYL